MYSFYTYIIAVFLSTLIIRCALHVLVALKRAEMASVANHHGKTNVIWEINPVDFGPFNVFHGEHFNNFAGGGYYMTTPKDDFVKLYRLYGGNAPAEGQYWTLEKRQGNDGYRHDNAVLQQWNNLQHAVELIVPKGVHMYEGFVGPQKGFLGGGWQVFIPRDVVQGLFRMQQNIGKHEIIAHEIKAIELFQKQKLKEWQDEMNRRIESAALAKGSFLSQLPSDVRRFLSQKAGEASSAEKVKEGKYALHRTSIPIFGGGRKSVNIFVTIQFVRSESRTYQSGKTIVTETTNYYNRITTIEENLS